MDKRNKRKLETDFESCPKKAKDEKIHLKLELENIFIVKFLEQQKKIKNLEKKVKRIEKFNEELREKNTKLELELQNLKENELCNNLSNINIINPYSYIN